jgi:hypothetical protein
VIMVFCTLFEGAPKMILRQFTQKPSLRAYSISAWRSHDYQMRMRQCTSPTETSTRASVRPNIARTSGTAGCVCFTAAAGGSGDAVSAAEGNSKAKQSRGTLARPFMSPRMPLSALRSCRTPRCLGQRACVCVEVRVGTCGCVCA